MILYVPELYWIFFRKALNKFEEIFLGAQDGWAYVLEKKPCLSQLHTWGRAPDTPKSMLYQHIILALSIVTTATAK